MSRYQCKYAFAKSGVSLGQSVLRFGPGRSKDASTQMHASFGVFVHAFVSSLGADVLIAPHFPKKVMPFKKTRSRGCDAPHHFPVPMC